MPRSGSIIGIYDFGLLPYALGDVLTWNIKTAIQCEEAERGTVDIHICLDAAKPSCFLQRELVNSDNYELFFTELYSAFGTHPRLGTVHIHRSRQRLLAELQRLRAEEAINAITIHDYFSALDSEAAATDAAGSQPPALWQYFEKYIHSLKQINDFAAGRPEIPLLKGIDGCQIDIDAISSKLFAGKKIVPFHLRLRRLDVGFGGEHTYARDSSFLEWYDFLRTAGRLYPDVQFVALGRLQEKPVDVLRLPNVMSLRELGMGLGHELTLLLQSDLFIGTSSGFGAAARFSSIPYFITKTTVNSCRSWAIPFGVTALPFARPGQELIYVPETSELLLGLLEKGLAFSTRERDRAPDVRPADAASPLTTARHSLGDAYRIEETARLLLPDVHAAKENWLNGKLDEARATVRTMWENFPEVCGTLPQFLLPAGGMAIEDNDTGGMQAWLAAIDWIASGKDEVWHELQILKIALVLALADRGSPAFADRFGELKARLEHASLLGPLSPVPLLPDFSISFDDARTRRVLRHAHEAKSKWLSGDLNAAAGLIDTARGEFAGVCDGLPQFLLPAGGIAIERGDGAGILYWRDAVRSLRSRDGTVPELVDTLDQCLTLALTNPGSPDLAWLFPNLKARLEHANLQSPLS